ncbi:MAG: PEP-CTERM sorting domain-containing protein [Planctomycetes bacterium]|nr:PEP-CTERM sorting domain-containing protein [Planctomycetota bacterium]
MGITQKEVRVPRYGGTMGVITVFAILCLVMPSSTLATVTYDFFNITGNSATNALNGESQLSVDVDNGLGTVTFTFNNDLEEVGVDMVISEIYFDDGSLLSINSILNDPPKVVFVQDASPPDLPGGNTLSPPFEVSLGFLIEGGAPPSKKGIGPGQSLSIMFDLINGGTLADVLDELDDGTLRIGIHVIAFADKGSESFVNVPEPATVLLLGLGSLALIRLRRRRS